MSAPYKRILTIDFETVWAPDYTLSSMTTEAYIRDPRFHAYGACIHEYGSGMPIQWYNHDELPKILGTYDWSTTAVLAHNARFDVGILSFVYGVRPAFIFDSLSMARALRGVEVGGSLAKLADAYGLPPKGQAVHSTKGLGPQLPPEVERELAAYCKHDIDLCELIFGKLLMRAMPDGTVYGEYPKKELRLIDMTVRMFTEPELELDVAMLEKALREEQVALANALEYAEIDDTTKLASNVQFANILGKLGVTVPMKISKTTGELTYALAKNDAHFQALAACGNPTVEALCAARLKVKSTLERTRAERFIDIADRGALPVPLNYYAAGTGRWGGSDDVNLQNMKRGSFLRKSIVAPDGYEICAGDLSQIEPRMLAWLADYVYLLDVFRAGGDPYATFGATMFNIPGLTKETHPLLRQSAKSALLGAGYMLSWASFAGQLLVGFLGAPPVRYTKLEAKALGVTRNDVDRFVSWEPNLERMRAIPHVCTEEELLIHCLAAKAIIDKYREAAAPVVDFWELLGTLLETCLYGGKTYTHKDVLFFEKGRIGLVNGMALQYPDIEVTQDDKGRAQYTYNTGKMRKRLHAGVICNNVTQALARIVMSDGLLRVQKRYRVKGTVHDEGLFLVPVEERDSAKSWIREEMTRVPSWLPGIVLAADVGVARRYGEAKG